MEAPAAMPITLSQNSFFVFIAVLIAVAVGLVAYMIFSRVNTVPSGLTGLMGTVGPIGQEGFQGPSKGVSTIPCGQESSDAIAILDMFASKPSSTGEGSADLSEFREILSKLCCMKHDLMSPTQVVQSMMTLQYNNTHDRENPADTVARCFTKSMPIRDLDITFGTWKQRGVALLNRLCTSYSFSSSESETAMRHFTKLWSDVFEIAKNSCIPPEKAPEYGSPRDPRGFTPESVEELGPYTGYF
jgi:hypothetical protein